MAENTVQRVQSAAGTNNALVTGKGTFYGASVAATGVVVVYDALTVTGDPIFQCGSPGLMLGDNTYRFTTGLTVVSTTAAATIYYNKSN